MRLPAWRGFFLSVWRHAELAKHLAWSTSAAGKPCGIVHARSFGTEVLQDDAQGLGKWRHLISGPMLEPPVTKKAPLELSGASTVSNAV